MRNRLTEYAHSILHKRLRHAMMSLYEWEGPMERYQIQSKDCLLQVYACGRFDRGTAIIFLHGGPGSGAQAIMELPAFRALEEDALCIHFDQRGSGASSYDLKKGLCIDTLTNDVLRVIQDTRSRWSVKRLYVWGGSFGGCLAALCLERFAQELTGCILSSPAISFSRSQLLEQFESMSAAFRVRMKELPQKAEDPPTPEALFAMEDFRAFIYSADNPSKSLRHICAMSSWFFQHSFHGLFDACEVPLLILQGKDDPVCSWRTLYDELAACERKTIIKRFYEHSGHEVFTDQRDAFLKEIRAFLKEEPVC